MKRREFLQKTAAVLPLALLPIGLLASPEYDLYREFSDFPTRYHDDYIDQLKYGEMIIIQTRWHSDDLFQKLLPAHEY